MKRYIGIFALLLALTLTACAPKQPSPAASSQPTPGVSVSQPDPPAPAEPDVYTFTRETLPGMDGSTSTAPYAQAMCAVLLGEDLDQAADLINFSRTTQSYKNLMNGGSARLLVAAEPPQEVLERMEAEDKWLFTPFAVDALVFVVNEDNPVDGLTAQQVQQIYAGEITNWKEVGGADLDIVPFQRNSEAGSQTMLKKLVMTDLPLMDPPTKWVSDSMSGILEAVREYDNSSAAIGYTVYYYANDMEMAKGLKVLAIDGVLPSAEAIRAGDYPFLSPYYVTIAEDEAQDSPVRILYDWILGPDGQKLAELEGYVPVSDVVSSDAPGVWTDWSVLDVGSEAILSDRDGGRWYQAYIDQLIPSNDYGPLLPYVGELVYRFEKWTDEAGNEQEFAFSEPTPMYGLMTAEGKIVTDPVYQGVSREYHWDRGTRTRLPVLILGQSQEEWEDTPGDISADDKRLAVAAEDGSWCTGFEFWFSTANGEELLLAGPNGLTQLNSRTGRREDWSWKQLGIPPGDMDQVLMELQWLYGFNWTEVGVYLGREEEYEDENSKVRVFDPDTAQVSVITVREFEDALDRYYSRHWGESAYWDMYQVGNQVVLRRGDEEYSLTLPEETDITGWQVAGGYASLSDFVGSRMRTRLFRLSDGALLLEGKDIGIHTRENDPDAAEFIQVWGEDGSVTLYHEDASLWLELPESESYWRDVTLENGRFCAYAGGDWFGCFDASSGGCLFFRNLGLGD